MPGCRSSCCSRAIGDWMEMKVGDIEGIKARLSDP